MSEFAEFARAYSLPVRDLEQKRPEAGKVSSIEAVRYRAGRLTKRRIRRLAYLDSTFPWIRSGFRFHEACALREAVPDTIFFSLWDMADPFPARVHSLADFPRIAQREGITDAYGVFQLFLAGLVGVRLSGPLHPMEGPDLHDCFRLLGIRLHGSIYPGGGFTNTPVGLAQTRELAKRLTTTFSYVPEVLTHVPGVTPVDQAFTETRFYSPTEVRWTNTSKLVCMFAADAPPRKGLEIALRAFAGLPASRFHLHVVGPHEHRRDEFPSDVMTFHGWLGPGELRYMHRHTHVFVSPVTAEPSGLPGAFAGVVDGFPTQAAADAMSSGCLLVSSNPALDHRVMTPGIHYIECESDSVTLQQVLCVIADDRTQARRIAEAGSRQVRMRMDVRDGVRAKLIKMGFLAPGQIQKRTTLERGAC